MLAIPPAATRPPSGVHACLLKGSVNNALHIAKTEAQGLMLYACNNDQEVKVSV